MKKFLFVVVMALLCVSGFSQTRFSIHAGGAFPMGDFKEGNCNNWALLDLDAVVNLEYLHLGNKGGAGIGFNAGLQVNVPITRFSDAGSLGLITSGDFFYNGYNSDIKDEVSDMIDWGENHFDDFSCKKPRIMNVPILLGLDLSYDVSDRFGLFAEAAVGPNIRFISKCKVQHANLEDTFKYKTAVTFGFQIGAGIMLVDKISVGLHYYGLGSSKVKVTEDFESGSHSESYKYTSKTMKCSELVVRLGYHF